MTEQAWICIERRVDGSVRNLRISNLPGYKDHCFFTGVSGHLPDCGVKLLVAPGDPDKDLYIASALRGVYVCSRCGSLVANDDRHDEWHDAN